MKKAVLFSFAVAMLSMSAAHAGLYRWVDDSGKVHYSDKMPAKASQKAHTEIGGQGIIKKEVNPLADLEAKKEKKVELSKQQMEELRLSKIKKEKREKLDKLQKRDDHLLSTYDNKDELIHYFENKIKMLEGNSNILLSHNMSLKKKVLKLQKQTKVTKHKITLNTLSKKIIRIKNSIKQYDQALQENAEEIIKLSENYQSDKKRFTELTQ